MYETKNQPLIGHWIFVRRLSIHAAIVIGLLIFSLGVGMVGYVLLEHLSWIDAFLNSAMLLGGMGPVNPPQTFGGKLFAGLYALFAGLVFIVSAGLLFTPVLHRVLHRLHLDQK